MISKDKQLDSVYKLLEKLLVKDYYGCLVVKIQAGNVVHMTTERMYRPEDLIGEIDE